MKGYVRTIQSESADSRLFKTNTFPLPPPATFLLICMRPNVNISCKYLIRRKYDERIVKGESADTAGHPHYAFTHHIGVGFNDNHVYRSTGLDICMYVYVRTFLNSMCALVFAIEI